MLGDVAGRSWGTVSSSPPATLMDALSNERAEDKDEIQGSFDYEAHKEREPLRSG